MRFFGNEQTILLIRPSDLKGYEFQIYFTKSTHLFRPVRDWHNNTIRLVAIVTSLNADNTSAVVDNVYSRSEDKWEPHVSCLTAVRRKSWYVCMCTLRNRLEDFTIMRVCLRKRRPHCKCQCKFHQVAEKTRTYTTN